MWIFNSSSTCRNIPPKCGREININNYVQDNKTGLCAALAGEMETKAQFRIEMQEKHDNNNARSAILIINSFLIFPATPDEIRSFT